MSSDLINENFTSSFSRLSQLHQKACRTSSTITFPHSTNQTIPYFSSFNQSDHWFVALSMLPSSLLKLPMILQHKGFNKPPRIWLTWNQLNMRPTDSWSSFNILRWGLNCLKDYRIVKLDKHDIHVLPGPPKANDAAVLSELPTEHTAQL